ncbi:MAG TPA: homoserine O-acetyltransferase [Ornithinimicrobium sp.]|uniref:homoserine O-acetyltransferase MetX n=1 Tax=Ornithinimicrobium sp. TaxID=1977084 RepID=UPI002B474F78|nr:homoserine O-acetyltransferase [Ornithinimicrobium sp.]HKJ11147.1 homoserine O-acetyltransferase [Ornithinimicrobium sp.]
MTVSADALPPSRGAAARVRSVRIGTLVTETGEEILDARMAVHSWGRLNDAGDNAVLVLHALTGDGHVIGDPGPGQPTPGWWPGLIGPGCVLDTDEYCVIAPNVLGGCRGSTGPGSPAPDGRPYGSSFPRLSIRDQVAAEVALADALGITSFAAVLGGSMGGMRALEWAVGHPGRVRRCLAIATNAIASADQIAWATPQIQAIRGDVGFVGGDYYPGPGPRNGLEVARQIAHTTYRSAGDLEDRFGAAPQLGEEPAAGGRYAVQSYLHHHGRKLVRRFDANTYLVLTEAMNGHDIGRGRGGVESALRRITADLTVAVVSSDRLFTPSEGAVIAQAPACRALRVIESPHGHDSFLIETEQVFALIAEALGSDPPPLQKAQVPAGRGASPRRLEASGLW